MFLKFKNSWKIALQKETNASYFSSLSSFLEKEYKQKSILPAKDSIFKAYEATPLNEVKVVILGQDPYPTKGHAHGLCFSVNHDVQPLPKSLKNIFKELESDTGKSIPLHGNLEGWSKQGVFLLNTVLTVEEGKPGSHQKKGWEEFTDATLTAINEYSKSVVFLLWGKHAQQKKKLIDTNKHLVLETAHPSPLSAYRGFFDSKHFSKANNYLKQQGLEEIDW